MQRDFNNRDFEQFVKQNADQYRMFPSEKVWQGIDNALHTRRKWYGVGLALLLLLTGTAVTFVMIGGSKTKQSGKTIAIENAAEVEKTDVSKEKNTNPPPLISVNNPITIVAPLFDQPVSNFPSKAEAEEKLTSSPIAPTSIAQTNSSVAISTVEKNILSVPVRKQAIETSATVNEFAPIAPVLSPQYFASNNDPAAEIQKQKVEETGAINQTRQHNDIYPLTIESVLNSYQPTAQKKRFSMQFYIAPNISYRKLSENKKFMQSAASNGTVPAYAGYSDINNIVSHKPDMGLELGFTGKYALAERFKLRAGLQFNVSRYDIQAAYYQLREDATIALDGGSFGPNQSIVKKTNYRNTNGIGASSWLKNLYYSVSLPLGAEILFKSKTNTQFGIAATFQPTYIIKDRAYLISTDYKNYVEVPSLVRKVNMNTSFEAFVAYSTGNINWQVGPQVRYQIQSSFKAKYPFKENLFDFGLKVGIQLNR